MLDVKHFKILELNINIFDPFGWFVRQGSLQLLPILIQFINNLLITFAVIINHKNLISLKITRCLVYRTHSLTDASHPIINIVLTSSSLQVPGS
jgi:hypothetical protein